MPPDPVAGQGEDVKFEFERAWVFRRINDGLTGVRFDPPTMPGYASEYVEVVPALQLQEAEARAMAAEDRATAAEREMRRHVWPSTRATERMQVAEAKVREAREAGEQAIMDALSCMSPRMAKVFMAESSYQRFKALASIGGEQP